MKCFRVIFASLLTLSTSLFKIIALLGGFLWPTSQHSGFTSPSLLPKKSPTASGNCQLAPHCSRHDLPDDVSIQLWVLLTAGGARWALVGRRSSELNDPRVWKGSDVVSFRWRCIRTQQSCAVGPFCFHGDTSDL